MAADDCEGHRPPVTSRPTMERRPLCIFDLDGTLYRSETSFLRTMHRIYEEFGVPSPGDAAILSTVRETYATFLEWLQPQGFPTDLEALGERISEIEFESIRTEGELFPGTTETLRTLQESGCRIALCTNGDRRYARFVLGAFDLLGCFDALMTNEDGRASKIEMVGSLLADLQPSVAIMVGDRYHDTEAGRANGCVVVGAGYGYGSPEEFAGADHVIDRIASLPGIVEEARRREPS